MQEYVVFPQKPSVGCAKTGLGLASGFPLPALRRKTLLQAESLFRAHM